MTSGIRSNWMKAIRLCMDLQNSNKAKESKQQDLSSSSSSSVRTNDDMDIDTSSTSSKVSDKSRNTDKKDFLRKNRRHYSDVNPGNISKMFSIQGLTLDKSLSQSTSSQSSAASSVPSSKEPAKEHDIKPELSLPSHMDLATTSKGKYEQFGWNTTSNVPFNRFVEGSDSTATTSGATVDQESKVANDKDEEERKRRSKSPSAKIKERSRAKSPKLHSPPPDDTKFTYRPTTGEEEDKMSVSSDDISYMDAEVCIG